ncbi:MAG: D-2-hydroxyacid dehydrogenase [Pseudomonadota bacterium]
MSRDAPKILLHSAETGPLAQALTARFPDLAYAECQTYADLPETIEEARPDIVYSVRFAGTPGFPRAALFGENGPSWISNGGVGTDHFGIWDPRRTTVTNAAGVAADMMAEYILGGFLHFTLGVPGLQADQAARRWDPRPMRPLRGQTLLILGLGHTGRAIAARAKAFGMTVLSTRANPRPTDPVDEVHAASDLPNLLPRADFIAICTPLIDETRHLIGADEIARMKAGVIVGDVSRGTVVDQTALLAGLRAGHIGGAVLDVFETEPLPVESPLWHAPNVLISPHSSSVYAGWEDASFTMFLDNLDRWIAGARLQNIVDPVRGY